MNQIDLEAAGWVKLDMFHYRSPYDGSVQRTGNAWVIEQYHRDGVDCAQIESILGFGAAITYALAHPSEDNHGQK